MSRLQLFFLILIGIPVANGQNPCTALNYHAFKAEALQGNYTDLGNLGTEIFPDDLDDGNSGVHEIGFEFTFHCQIFTQFILNTNGFIKLGAETTPKDNLFFSNAQSVSGGVFHNADSNNVNLIVPFNHDIERGVDEPDFRVYTSGTAPNRVCTIQWENMREWTYDPAKQYDNMDFQVRLYETTNVIEFVYGEWDPSTAFSNFKTAACGLKGSGPDDDQLLVVVKSSAATWDNVIFKNGNYAANEAFHFGNPPDRPRPEPGLTYRFTPTYQRDLTVQELYATGIASTYYSSPQDITACIRNSGFDTMFHIPVILETIPNGNYTDTQYIPSLAFGESAKVTFRGYQPDANGVKVLKLRLETDDNILDNFRSQIQTTTDLDLNYTTDGGADAAVGFLAGVQGIYYNRYPIHGEAKVVSVHVFISEDEAAIGKNVFAAILDESGVMVARSENITLTLEDLYGWKTFTFDEPPVVRDRDLYAGFGMISGAQAYKALGVQTEDPLRAHTYFTSFITGNGLTAADTLTSTDRYMIGVTLAGTPPIAGELAGDQIICNGQHALLQLTGYTGFITWQSSPDGLDPWQLVSQGHTGATYQTSALEYSTYYRAEVFQPGFPAVVSNTVLVEVSPETPEIIASGDVLISSVEEGNQWYHAEGPIEGATSSIYLVTQPGTYYVIVTSGECVSPPSNLIDILSVQVQEVPSSELARIFPNPFSEALMVHVTGYQGVLFLKVFDVHGKEVLQHVLTEDTVIPVSHLEPGMYYSTLVSGAEIQSVRLFKPE